MAGSQVAAILRWYASQARDLPWRRPTAGPWAVLVSEVMLQQTPVARVLPAYEAWLARWPTPASLAAASAADAVRQWGRLGYPRRALRLHGAARVICERHRGEVPDSVDDLLALPGVGAYTAAAVASFAFGQRHAVLDTNVRRVLARPARRPPRPAAPGTDAAAGHAQYPPPPAPAPKPAPQPARQVAHTEPAPPNAAGYVERYPEGAAALKAMGYWPYGPIIGDILPDGTQAMDWRFNEKREVVYDPGWWRNIPAAKVKH